MKWPKFGSVLQDFISERLSNIWTTLYDENILNEKKNWYFAPETRFLLSVL